MAFFIYRCLISFVFCFSTFSSAQEVESPSQSTPTPDEIFRSYLIDLSEKQAQFLESIEVRRKGLEQLNVNLREIEGKINWSTAHDVSQAYSQTSSIWRETVTDLVNLYSDLGLDKFPSAPSEKVEDSLQREADEKREIFLRQRVKVVDQLKAQTFKLLSVSGTLRAKILRRCDQLECRRPQGLEEESLRDVYLEIKIVPFKLLSAGLSKWIEFDSKLGAGLKGWVDLARQVFILFLLLLIPFFLIRFLRWSANQLDQLRRDLFSRSMLDYKKRTQLALLIARLNPFLPSLGMVFSLHIARRLLGTTDLQELSGFLFYVEVFFIYRVVRRLFEAGFEVVFSTDAVDQFKNRKEKIRRSAARISRLIFVEFVILHLIEDAVRQALAYELFSNIIFWYNIALLFVESFHWRIEIERAFQKRFPSVWKRLENLSLKWPLILLLPVLLLFIALQDILIFTWRYLARFDLVKRLMSELLKKRLESSDFEESTRVAVPKEYLDIFDYYLPADQELYVELSDSGVSLTLKAIDKWLQGKTSHIDEQDLLIIIGNRGMGKTTSLQQIYHRLPNEVDKRLVEIQSKILSSQDLFSWLSKALDAPVTKLEDILDLDEGLDKPLVLCIDDIHNLFLSSIGGFEAYRMFLEILGLKTEKLFWCLTVNQRSWDYLIGFFGSEHFYGQLVKLRPWKDFEIQKLIVSRHNRSHLRRQFDDSIRAYGAGDVLGQQVETQFFRLLWGQARGNPRSSLMYWISAVSFRGMGTIHVGVPRFVESSVVSSLSNDSLFLLAAIAKHGSLVFSELSQVTGISHFTVRKFLKLARAKDLIWVDKDEKIRITSKTQYVIDYYLIGKNFLYE